MANRRNTGVMVDDDVVQAARVKLGLPENTRLGATIRAALAHVAGTDMAEALDTRRGMGALTYRQRKTADQAAAAEGNQAA